MLESLDIWEEQRSVYLMFHLFDRSDRGFFTREQFEDVVMEIMQPNYVSVVRQFNTYYQQKLSQPP